MTPPPLDLDTVRLMLLLTMEYYRNYGKFPSAAELHALVLHPH